MSEVCANLKAGLTLEIGVGTGNLTDKLIDSGASVIGVEPSTEMRKLATKKNSDLKIYNGHFLNISSTLTIKFDNIVSSYAFHHLTLSEKRQAIQYLKRHLNPGGRIVIADTMFESAKYKKELYSSVKKNGQFNLLEDLNSEYYELLESVTSIFEDFNFQFNTKKMNEFVWVITAQRRD
ncbi:class I SAM-dependent methyltransferase [Proteinivorax tanatarense]|uniref:Class I SAM-dependent methyltransferase n=1 Tax=Proteinivorax tanatarense TaxID=1260629 RepID=A0AAU7VNA8_9FIRM